MRMIINSIEARSLVDGPGERAVLFMQGCMIRCPGCQNQHLWEPSGGRAEDVENIADTLAALGRPVTISGGEPFNQPQALTYLLRDLRARGIANIILYTGYKWETITSPMSGAWLWIREVLDRVDVVVDGPYTPKADNDFVNWRGSGNQRPINVKASMAAGAVVLANWDAPVITIAADGTASAPAGLRKTLNVMGTIQNSRMCGQTRTL